MFKIIVSPYSRKMRNGNRNPKDYPYWKELVKLLKDMSVTVVQVGISGEEKIDGVDEVLFNKPLKELMRLVEEYNVWISVDNFFPHLCNLIGKPGVVIFSQSDPDIFGYEQNVNLLKDRKYLREKQFDIWEACEYKEDAFVAPEIIVNHLIKEKS